MPELLILEIIKSMTRYLPPKVKAPIGLYSSRPLMREERSQELIMPKIDLLIYLLPPLLHF